MAPLTEERLQELAKTFQRDGYAVIEDFLSPEEVEEIRKESLRLIVEESTKEHKKQIFGNDLNARSEYFVDSSDTTGFFFEKKAFDQDKDELIVPLEQSLAKLAHGLHYRNPIFRKATTNDRVKSVFKAIGFGDPRVTQSMVIFKNPKVGGEYTPHQDASFLCTEPVHLAGIWYALDDATPENGCLEFIPGSHKGKLERKFVLTSPEKRAQGELLEWTDPPVQYEEKQFVAAPVKRGSMVVLDGLVVHRSAPNNSDKSRWIYTFHVFDKTRSEYSKENWLQLKNEKDFVSIYAG